MPRLLQPLVIEEISFVDKGASGDEAHRPEIVFWKGADMPDASKVESILARMDEEDRAVMVEALAAAGKAEEDKADDPPMPEDEEEKAEETEPAVEPEKQDPEEEEEEEMTEKRDASVDSEIAKRDAEIAKRDAEIAALKAEKVLASFIKMAEDDLTHIPGMGHDAMGSVLKVCSERLPKETFASLKTTLTACSRAIEKGDLLVELGSDADGSSAIEKLDSLARELHEKTPDKTFEQCYAVVTKSHPDLYVQSQSEGQ